jgi:osmotically-inducible protein OsmY
MPKNTINAITMRGNMPLNDLRTLVQEDTWIRSGIKAAMKDRGHNVDSWVN